MAKGGNVTDIKPQYLTLKQLGAYAGGLSTRFWRDALKDPEHPLPHFRLNSKIILVNRDDLEKWLETHFRADSSNEVDIVVNLVMAGVGR